MRIFNRTDFLKLPPGTMYCKGCKWDFGPTLIKGDTINEQDWTFRSINWIEGETTEESMEKMTDMLVNGSSHPMEDAYGRDSTFDPSELFLVYEEKDLLELKDLIQNAINNTNRRM